MCPLGHLPVALHAVLSGLLISIHTFCSTNESVSRQWRPWSGCASAQSAIWAFAVHICLRTRFRMAWQIYGWFFKLFSLISWYLNIQCVFIYFMLLRERERETERERDRDRAFITLNWLLNCGKKQCKYKIYLAIFYSVCPLTLSSQAKSNVSLCFPVFLYTHHRAKLRREVTPPMKIIKTLIKSLLFQKIRQNLAIRFNHTLFNSVYVYIYTNHGKLDNIFGFR